LKNINLGYYIIINKNNTIKFFYKKGIQNSIDEKKTFNKSFFFYFYYFFLKKNNKLFIDKSRFFYHNHSYYYWNTEKDFWKFIFDLFSIHFLKKIKINNFNFWKFNFNPILKNFFYSKKIARPYSKLFYSLGRKPIYIKDKWIGESSKWGVNMKSYKVQKWNTGIEDIFILENFFYL